MFSLNELAATEILDGTGASQRTRLETGHDRIAEVALLAADRILRPDSQVTSIAWGNALIILDARSDDAGNVDGVSDNDVSCGHVVEFVGG